MGFPCGFSSAAQPTGVISLFEASRLTLSGSSVGWLLASGVGNALGLLLAYQGLRVGKVGVVGPILSTEGAVAALLAVAAGQQLGVPRIAALSVIAVGTPAA